MSSKSGLLGAGETAQHPWRTRVNAGGAPSRCLRVPFTHSGCPSPASVCDASYCLVLRPFSEDCSRTIGATLLDALTARQAQGSQ